MAVRCGCERTRRYRHIDSSTLRSSWHKLSNGPSSSSSSPQRPLQPSIHVGDNGNDNDNDEDEEEYNDACCMYAICASETSSCRLLLFPLPLRGDDDDDDDGAAGDGRAAAARKEEDDRRRNKRVTEVKTARMAVTAELASWFTVYGVWGGGGWFWWFAKRNLRNLNDS